MSYVGFYHSLGHRGSNAALLVQGWMESSSWVPLEAEAAITCTVWA